MQRVNWLRTIVRPCLPYGQSDPERLTFWIFSSRPRRPLFNRRGQFLMHFPVNQLAHCAAVYPSPSLPYWLVKRISFRSQTQSRDHKPQKFDAPELTDLHVKLFFSFPSCSQFFGNFLWRSPNQRRISLCAGHYGAFCTCVARFGGGSTSKWKQTKNWLRLRSFRVCRDCNTCNQLGLPQPHPAHYRTFALPLPPCPTPCCVTLRRLRGRAPKLALIQDNH